MYKQPPLKQIPTDIIDAHDYAQKAKDFIAYPTLCYIKGGSGKELTQRRNRKIFNNIHLYNRVGKCVKSGHCRLELYNQSFAHPIFLAPIAHQKLIHEQGEIATAKGADAMNSCMLSSTNSSYTLEEIAKVQGRNGLHSMHSMTRLLIKT